MSPSSPSSSSSPLPPPPPPPPPLESRPARRPGYRPGPLDRVVTPVPRARAPPSLPRSGDGLPRPAALPAPAPACPAPWSSLPHPRTAESAGLTRRPRGTTGASRVHGRRLPRPLPVLAPASPFRLSVSLLHEAVACAVAPSVLLSTFPAGPPRLCASLGLFPSSFPTDSPDHRPGTRRRRGTWVPHRSRFSVGREGARRDRAGVICRPPSLGL